MSNLNTIAFDTEISEFNDDTLVPVAGFAHTLRDILICNLDNRPADRKTLTTALNNSEQSVQLDFAADKHALTGVERGYVFDTAGGVLALHLVKRVR
jgi:hypothetical protein